MFWLLEAKKEHMHTKWDVMLRVVVRAASEKEARELAQKCGGCEIQNSQHEDREFWTVPEFATCVPVPFDGESEVIIRDVHEG